MSRKHNIVYIIRICCIAALGGILLGYDTAVISGAIGPISKYFNLLPAQTGWAVSCVVLGSIIGALSAGWSTQKYGRRYTLFISALLFAISAIGSAVAQTFGSYILFRIIGGIAVGLACVASPMYMSEVAPKDFRGRAVSMFQQSAVIGQTCVFYVNYLIAKGMSEEWLIKMGWRWMLGSEIIPALLFAGLLFLIPESPRWLVEKGKLNKAKKTLSHTYNPKHVDQLIKEIQDSLIKHRTTHKIKTSLRSRPLLSILLIGTFVAAAQQLIGINVIMYYTPNILKPLVGGTTNALFQTTFVGLVFIIGNALGMYLIDKIGRLPLMKYGTLGCALGMFILGCILYQQTQGYAALLALCLYVIAYAISWGCACWTIISEIFPNRIRSRAMAIAVGAQWFTGFIVTQSFPMLNQNPYLKTHFNGAFSFWLLSILSLICMLIVIKFVPETKGISLEKMEQLMTEKLAKNSKKQSL
ncbi:sugar porter family MFS transporter [uncultured Shewanella sp.]|uniref:sugar porter family MFS transporter n=1 Tax=uncultured Shewanella sp. TaxID=173975 RepID=UPI00260C8960|nr:sugar porter family MFS transporter [uncultured Shewanella sp.]